VFEKLKNIPETDFSRAMEKLEKPAKSCIISNGDYNDLKIYLKQFLNLVITFMAIISNFWDALSMY